jgi:nitroreductase
MSSSVTATHSHRTGRTADYPIDVRFLDRWSPRALSGAPLAPPLLFTLFEAARWAPSSNNRQPWRFIYAHRETPAFDTLFGLLNEGNQRWCVRAAVLLVLVSKSTTAEGTVNRTHQFDAGAAWSNMAHQATIMGLVIHAMAGFDHDRARVELGVPEDYTIQAMIAVGHPGRVEDLTESQRAREKPSTRMPITDFIFEGRFKE